MTASDLLIALSFDMHYKLVFDGTILFGQYSNLIKFILYKLYKGIIEPLFFNMFRASDKGFPVKLSELQNTMYITCYFQY